MRKAGICLVILFFTLKAAALDAVTSHTLFYKVDNTERLKPNIEVYWQVNPNTLHYVSTPGHKIQASIRTDIVLTGDAGIIAQDHYVLKTLELQDIGEIMQHSIIDLRRYDLPTGKVRLRFKLTDMADSTNRYSYSDSFEVSDPGNTPLFSGVELVDTMGNSNGVVNIFTHNGKMKVPASTNFYDNSINSIRYYAELYNCGQLAKADYPLIVRTAISKNASEGVYANFERKDTLKEAKAVQYTSGEFKIGSLPSGNYYIRLSVENSAHIILASQNIFFQRLKKHPESDTTIKTVTATNDTGIENVTVLNLKKTFIAKYSLAEVRAILKMLLPFSDPMATRTINGFLKKPDEMYMRYYVYNFFASVDKNNPGAAWREFAKKIEEVNKRFGTHGTRGYETDRGFMYLRYGAPTDVITVESEQGALPYEIWQYNNLTLLNHKPVTDALFLFYRPNEIASDFKLLHSTVPGEIQNSGWRMMLYTNPGQNDMSGSRAEQYIGNR